MSQPMLRVELEVPSRDTPKETATAATTATAHLLPCRVHHTGSVEPAQSFWDPKPSESEKFPLPHVDTDD